MLVYFLVAIWILAVVPAVVGHRRAHRADALVSFAAFQARGRMLTGPTATADGGPSMAARRQRVAGVFLVVLTVCAVVAIIVQETWSTALVAGMLQVVVFWYGAVVRSQLAR